MKYEFMIIRMPGTHRILCWIVFCPNGDIYSEGQFSDAVERMDNHAIRHNSVLAYRKMSLPKPNGVSLSKCCKQCALGNHVGCTGHIYYGKSDPKCECRHAA